MFTSSRQEICLEIYSSVASGFLAELLEAFGPEFSANLLVLQDTDFCDCLGCLDLRRCIWLKWPTGVGAQVLKWPTGVGTPAAHMEGLEFWELHRKLGECYAAEMRRKGRTAGSWH